MHYYGRFKAGRALLVAIATVLIAVGIAAVFATANTRSLNELPGFFVWSIPLGATIGLFARQPRLPRLPAFARAIATALLGLAAGLVSTMLGWAIMGGWMLAWNFPVLYCWTLAGVIGALSAMLLHRAGSPTHAAIGGFVALLPLAALWVAGNQPEPGVIIVYRDQPSFDAAQYVLDSVLTVPYPGGTGRDLRWPSRSYARMTTANGATAALIVLEHASDREAIRQVLAGNKFVQQVRDTVISR
jgi:hypothetical protein